MEEDLDGGKEAAADVKAGVNILPIECVKKYTVIYYMPRRKQHTKRRRGGDGEPTRKTPPPLPPRPVKPVKPTRPPPQPPSEIEAYEPYVLEPSPSESNFRELPSSRAVMQGDKQRAPTTSIMSRFANTYTSVKNKASNAVGRAMDISRNAFSRKNNAKEYIVPDWAKSHTDAKDYVVPDWAKGAPASEQSIQDMERQFESQNGVRRDENGNIYGGRRRRKSKRRRR